MQAPKLTGLPTELCSNIVHQLGGKARQQTLLAICLDDLQLVAIGRDDLYGFP
jgi:hypothetical protein